MPASVASVHKLQDEPVEDSSRRGTIVSICIGSHMDVHVLPSGRSIRFPTDRASLPALLRRVSSLQPRAIVLNEGDEVASLTAALLVAAGYRVMLCGQLPESVVGDSGAALLRYAEAQPDALRSLTTAEKAALSSLVADRQGRQAYFALHRAATRGGKIEAERRELAKIDDSIHRMVRRTGEVEAEDIDISVKFECTSMISLIVVVISLYLLIWTQFVPDKIQTPLYLSVLPFICYWMWKLGILKIMRIYR